MSEKTQLTVTSVSEDLDVLAERVVQQGVLIQDLQAAEKDQNGINDLHSKRMNRLSETDETIDRFLSDTHGQLQHLKVHCDLHLVHVDTFIEEMERQSRANLQLNDATKQLQDELTAKFVTLKSELDWLRGFVEGGFEQLGKNQERLDERIEMLCDEVHAPTWRDRLAAWWWNLTHWRENRETNDDIRI